MESQCKFQEGYLPCLKESLFGNQTSPFTQLKCQITTQKCLFAKYSDLDYYIIEYTCTLPDIYELFISEIIIL